MAVTTSARRILLTGTGLSAFLTLTHTTNDAFTSMLSALLPTMQTRFSLTETMLAVLVATLSLSGSMMQPFFGALADRLGRRLVGSLGVITSSALLALMGVIPNPWLLLALLLVGGLGSAAFHPSSTSMARGAARGKNKSLAISIFSAGGTLGLALGPVVTLFVVSHFGLRFTPWLMLPGVTLGVLMYFLVPAQERPDRAHRPKLFDARLFAGPVGMLCVAGIFRTVAWVTFINAFPLWLVNVKGVSSDATLLGVTLGVFSASAGIGGVLASALAPRLGRRPLISGSMLAAMPLLFSVFSLPPGSPLYFLAVALAGALANAALPLMVVSAQDLAPQAIGTASGMLMGLTWGTAGLLYIFIGRLEETLGLTSAMSISFLALLPGALLAFYVLHKHRALLPD